MMEFPCLTLFAHRNPGTTDRDWTQAMPHFPRLRQPSAKRQKDKVKLEPPLYLHPMVRTVPSLAFSIIHCVAIAHGCESSKEQYER